MQALWKKPNIREYNNIGAVKKHLRPDWRNGVGKTTLFRILAGLLQLSSGTFSIMQCFMMVL